MCTTPNSFGVDDEAEEAIQMELIILLYNSVLKKNLVTSVCPVIDFYLPAHRFPRHSMCL